MATELRELGPARTLNGKFDGYCHVCWNAVYVLWVDKEDPGGRCMFGHTAAHDCPDAMTRAQTAAQLHKLREAGLLKPLPATPDPEKPLAPR